MRARLHIACAWVFVLALGIGLWPPLAVCPEKVVNAAARDDGKVTLVAVGDIMLSRAVARHIKANRDVNYPFLHVRNYLKEADVVFGNLECPITPGPVVKHGTFFRADPGVEQGLRWAGFNVLSLANNHIPNFGPRGVLNTMTYLDRAQIAHVGAGKDSLQAAQPVFIVKNGIRVAFLAYNDNDVVPKTYGAVKDHAGTNFMDVDNLRAAVKFARATADFVIVSMHSGREYSKPNSRQMGFAHAAIDAGADLVIGHHPHVVQPIEQYKGKYIFYSLGNFVFDQTWSEATSRGLIIRAVLSKDRGIVFDEARVRIEHASQPWIIDPPKLLASNSPETH